MAQVVVRNIEDSVKQGLKSRAMQHGWSMEEELRQILRRAVNEPMPAKTKLGSRIAQRFAEVGLTDALPELHGQNIEAMDLSA